MSKPVDQMTPEEREAFWKDLSEAGWRYDHVRLLRLYADSYRADLDCHMPLSLDPPVVKWIGEVVVDYGFLPEYALLHGIYPVMLDDRWFDVSNEVLKECLASFEPCPARESVPRSGVKTIRCGYLYLGRRAKDADVYAEAENFGVDPATHLETMYFGRAFPREQYRWSIVGLGSSASWNGSIAFIRLGNEAGVRSSVVAIPRVPSEEWGARTCFLVVERQ